MPDNEKENIYNVNSRHDVLAMTKVYSTTKGLHQVEGEDPSVILHEGSGVEDEREDPDVDHIALLDDEDDFTRKLQKMADDVPKRDEYDPQLSKEEYALAYKANPGASMRVAVKMGAAINEVKRIDPKTGEERMYLSRNLDDDANKTPREVRTEYHVAKRTKETNDIEDAVEAVDRISARL